MVLGLLESVLGVLFGAESVGVTDGDVSLAAAEKIASSDFCHKTTMPSPKISDGAGEACVVVETLPTSHAPAPF